MNVLNPDGLERKLTGKDWVNPCTQDFSGKNKQKIAAIIKDNKEGAQKAKVAQEA